MIFRTDQMSNRKFILSRRWVISPLHFQIIPPLGTIYLWISLLQIFVNIHLRIKYLSTRNGAPVIMIPVTILKRTLLSTPTFQKWYLAGGIFSLTFFWLFKLLLPFLFIPVPYSFSGFLLLGGNLQTYLALVLVSLVPPVLLSVVITTPFTATLPVRLSYLSLCYTRTQTRTFTLRLPSLQVFA